MAKSTKAAVSAKNSNGAKHVPPIVEADIKRKVGRPRKEALTVEQEIVVLHNKISKLVVRVNAIEEMVLEVKDGQDKVAPKAVVLRNQPVTDLGQIDASITEIKEMLLQLMDSIEEEG